MSKAKLCKYQRAREKACYIRQMLKRQASGKLKVRVSSGTLMYTKSYIFCQ
jgi:hypothetical protein